jgi:hypothetical protein
MSSTIDVSKLTVEEVSAALSNFTPEQLAPLRAQIDDTFTRGSNQAPAAAGKKGAKKNKDGKEKVKRKGSPGAWSDWTKKVMIDCAAEIAAYKEAAEQKAGAHLKWLKESTSKGKTSADWLAFKAEWDAAHPKGAKASDAEEAEEADDSDSNPAAGGGGSVAAVAAVAAPVAEKVAKRRGPKKLTDMTPEERAAHDAKVAERKATKNAGATALEVAAKAAVPVPTAALVAEPKLMAAPVAAPVAAPKPAPVAEEAAEEAEEEDSVELKVFIVDGQKYMRPWSSAAKDWATGDLWYTNKKGERAAYWGELMEDGSVNADAEEPPLA